MKMLWLMMLRMLMLLLLLLLLLWHGGYHRCLYHRKALGTVGTHTTTGSVRSFNYVFLFLLLASLHKPFFSSPLLSNRSGESELFAIHNTKRNVTRNVTQTKEQKHAKVPKGRQ